MLNIAIFINFVCYLITTPAQGVTFNSSPVQETVVQDSVSLLANEWGLRERLQKENGKLLQVTPLEPLRLALYPDQTYKLVRQHDRVNYLDSIETVEWGNWEVNEDRCLIRVQVTNVDGRSILSAMLTRWQIEKLTPQQLVLNQFRFGDQVLVLERAK